EFQRLFTEKEAKEQLKIEKQLDDGDITKTEYDDKVYESVFGPRPDDGKEAGIYDYTKEKLQNIYQTITDPAAALATSRDWIQELGLAAHEAHLEAIDKYNEEIGDALDAGKATLDGSDAQSRNVTVDVSKPEAHFVKTVLRVGYNDGEPLNVQGSQLNASGRIIIATPIEKDPDTGRTLAFSGPGGVTKFDVKFRGVLDVPTDFAGGLVTQEAGLDHRHRFSVKKDDDGNNQVRYDRGSIVFLNEFLFDSSGFFSFAGRQFIKFLMSLLRRDPPEPPIDVETGDGPDGDDDDAPPPPPGGIQPAPASTFSKTAGKKPSDSPDVVEALVLANIAENVANRIILDSEHDKQFIDVRIELLGRIRQIRGLFNRANANDQAAIDEMKQIQEEILSDLNKLFGRNPETIDGLPLVLPGEDAVPENMANFQGADAQRAEAEGVLEAADTYIAEASTYLNEVGGQAGGAELGPAVNHARTAMGIAMTNVRQFRTDMENGRTPQVTLEDINDSMNDLGHRIETIHRIREGHNFPVADPGDQDAIDQLMNLEFPAGRVPFDPSGDVSGPDLRSNPQRSLVFGNPFVNPNAGLIIDFGPYFPFVSLDFWNADAKGTQSDGSPKPFIPGAQNWDFVPDDLQFAVGIGYDIGPVFKSPVDVAQLNPQLAQLLGRGGVGVYRPIAVEGWAEQNFQVNYTDVGRAPNA
uniref:hypothetical protein n=1 Tax=uncultured Roseobacter sp. TaxID=114847 RepID=UPI002603B0BB